MSLDFVDQAIIEIHSGNGGAGAISFQRERYMPRGGPDGGDGGKGGDVWARVNEQLYSLRHLRYQQKLRAENGDNGRSGQRHGKNGADCWIDVPLGTKIIDKESGIVLANLDAEQRSAKLLTGGRGGKGNAYFKSAHNQLPRFAQEGEMGTSRSLIVHVSLIADVALVGFPNVGKSSVLAELTAARPKIGDYHFTSKKPVVGVCMANNIKDDRLVIVDMPAIIDRNNSMYEFGRAYLHHLLMVNIIVYVLSLEPIEGNDPYIQYNTVRRVIGEYNHQLLNKITLCVATKGDLLSAERAKSELEALTTKLEVPLIVLSRSVQNNGGLDQLREKLFQYLDVSNST